MSKALILVAIALLGSAAAQTTADNRCTFDYNRIWEGGSQIAGPTVVATLAECCTSCQQNPQCNAINYRFDNSDPVRSVHTCTQFDAAYYSLTYLYGSHFGYIRSRVDNITITGGATTVGRTTGVQTTGVQTPTNQTNYTSCIGRREPGVDYWVGYINRTSNVTEAQCCDGCKATTACNAYSWGTDGTCYYRAYRGGFHGTYLMNSGYRVNSSMPAATGFTCAAATRENNTDYWGPNLSQAMTGSEAECCAVCQSYQGCGAYSWTVEDDVCYIKPYASNRHQSPGIRSGYTVNFAASTTNGGV